MDGEGQNRTAGEPGGRGVGGSLPRVMDGEGQNRTADTTIFSRVLYQLSYLAGSQRLDESGPATGASRSRPSAAGARCSIARGRPGASRIARRNRGPGRRSASIGSPGG